jgi:leucyl/phenylalanyl-tRNA--protein transferase
MTFYRLHNSYPGFPDPRDAEPSGLLAMGGDLSPERLLIAYSMGVFPWYNPGDPILWHCPDPRMVLLPKDLHVGRSMRPVLRRTDWQMRYDTAFSEVIRACAQIERNGQQGTWITVEMIKAYERLHELGFAHSAEVWQGDRLIAGLYGLALGRAFFGESMFYYSSGASKFALVHLVRRLREKGYDLIDCQQQTAHTERFGAALMKRSEFLELLSAALCHETERGNWTECEAD